MKKYSRFLLIVLAVVAVLSVAIYALSAPGQKSDSVETAQMVQFQDAETPVAETLSALTDNPQFIQHGFQVRAVSDVAEPLSVEQMIDRNTAIETAIETALQAAQSRVESGAVSIHAVLADFTDTETSVLPESNVSMTNVRVWIVTFSGVTIERGGPAGMQAEPVLADLNIVIDAHSGEILETFAYTA